MWSILGISIAALGNILTVALWTWAVLSTPSHTDARYLVESLAAGLLDLATLFFALPFGLVGFGRPGKRVLACFIIVLSLTPFPVSFFLLHALVAWHHVTLAP